MEQRLTNLFDLSGSKNRKAVIATTFADNYIALGKGFNVETRLSVASGDTEYDIAFDASGLTNKLLIAYPTVWATTSGPLFVDLGVCTSYTGGTAITPTNITISLNIDWYELEAS